MDNVTFLKQMKNIYESLNHLTINNDYLILNTDKIYMIPFSNVTLANLNPKLFLLDPNEIFHILYILELLPKETLTNNEIIFIQQYVQRYLKLNDEALTNSNMDQNLILGINIPIYTSYDPEYTTKPCAQQIQNIINNHCEELESGRGNQVRLVRANPNTNVIYEDPIASFEKAGFTTLLLIIGAVASTCIYIAYFIIGR